jgi:hypothetical protein
MERRESLIPTVDSICGLYREEDGAMENQDSSTKLEIVMHYIIWRCQDPTTLGAEKLNKVLFFSDICSYLELGKPITGISYIKRQFGPVPNEKDFFSARNNLEQNRKIAVTKDLYYKLPQYQFVALEKPDISSLSPEEVSILDIITEEICQKHTASSISEKTHNIIWEAAEIGEEIPLFAVFSSRFGEITEKDIQWAKSEIHRLHMA